MSPILRVSWLVLGAAVGSATWRNEPLLIPHLSREHWLSAAVGGLRLHIGDQRPSSDPRRFRWSECLLTGQRRVWCPASRHRNGVSQDIGIPWPALSAD